MGQRGLCAMYDGEELAVKNANSFNDQYDILTSGMYIRRDMGSTARPATPPGSERGDRDGRHVPAWARGLLAALAVAAVVLLVDFFYWRQSARALDPVGAEPPLRGPASLVSALERYPKFRPPLYPVLLWLAEAAGIAALRVNELIFLATLPLLYVLARRSLGGVRASHPVLLYAVANFNYVNLHQPTAEGLFVLLSLLLVLGLAGVAREDEGWFPLGLTTLATAGLCLTRYFAVYFAVPP